MDLAFLLPWISWNSLIYYCKVVVVVELLSPVGFFAIPWTAARQASLSFTISWSLLKLMSIKLAMPPTMSSSVSLFSACAQSFPVSGSFPMSWLFTSGSQSIGDSVSVLRMNIQDWFPLGLTGLILLSKGLSRIFSSTTVWKHQFIGTQGWEL